MRAGLRGMARFEQHTAQVYPQGNIVGIVLHRLRINHLRCLALPHVDQQPAQPEQV